MLELISQFTPADGGPPRPITLRISDVRETDASWSAQVDVLGFVPDYTTRVHGMDWAQAIELAARFVALECGKRGGALDPPIFPRTVRAASDDDADQAD